jgi:cytochrome P450
VAQPLPLPPGPSQPFGINPLTFHLHRLEKFSGVARDYGDISSFRLGPVRLAVLNHPDLVREVLVTHDDWFHKGRGVNELKRILGEGLLTSEGDFHRRQRRIIQPIFNHDKIAGYGTDMVGLASQARERWHDGDKLDIAREMMRLTLAVVGKTLFGVDVEGAAGDVGHSLETMMRWTMNLISPYGALLDMLPLPGHSRFREGLAKLDAVLNKMILERRAKPGQGDLLARMLAAQDVEGDGQGMNDRQLRDEAMTLFLAGHETTAQALSFTWYLLAQHPEIEAKLWEELGQVLGDRPPTSEDYPKLPYTRKVLSESMRLYPPAWIIARNAQRNFELRGYRIPKGTLVITCQYISHRDPRFFPDPERFDPERFTPEAIAARPRYAYYPFGGGSRVCIGEGFAMMEGTLLLATLAQRWKFRLEPGFQLELEPLITLRPRHGIAVRAQERS